jgi:transposase
VSFWWEVPVLGRVDPQASFWDTEFAVGHLVDGDSFYAKLARHGPQLVGDEDFAGWYAAGRGRPSIPPSILMRAVLLALHDGTSDRESARRVRMDLGWKHALGLPLDHSGFHPTTFSVFRSRIVLHAADERLFRRVVDRAVRAGVLPRRSLQLIDSSAVLGAGAVCDTYELLRRGISQLVRAAGAPTLPTALRRRLARYLKDTKPRINWQDPAARRAELGRMVAAADRLLAATAGRPELAEAAELLRRLVDQDVERTPPDGGGPKVKQQVAPDRIISTRDPDMRHGRKSKQHRFDGYKLHVVEEPSSELVTAVDVTPANTPDGQVAAALVRQAGRHGVAPRELVGDMAYGAGDVRAEVAAAGATVVAKVPPHANAGRFGKHDFTVDLADPARPRATCPAGVVATEVRGNGRDRRGRSRATLFFPASACAACPLRARCVGGTGPRTLMLNHHELLLQQARAAEHVPGVRRKLRRRPVIERKIAHLKRHGLGRARWVGRRKVLLQARLTATLVNLERLFVLDGFASRQPAPHAA